MVPTFVSCGSCNCPTLTCDDLLFHEAPISSTKVVSFSHFVPIGLPLWTFAVDGLYILHWSFFSSLSRFSSPIVSGTEVKTFLHAVSALQAVMSAEADKIERAKLLVRKEGKRRKEKEKTATTATRRRAAAFL